jgi:hypothetical protein
VLRPHLEVDPRQADRRRVPGVQRPLVPEAEVRGQVEGPEHLPSEDILVDTLHDTRPRHTSTALWPLLPIAAAMGMSSPRTASTSWFQMWTVSSCTVSTSVVGASGRIDLPYSTAAISTTWRGAWARVTADASTDSDTRHSPPSRRGGHPLTYSPTKW